MKYNYKFAFFVLSLLFMTSCASTYKYIYPKQISYGGLSEDSNVVFEYKYNVLQESGNNKYAKKELKKNLRVIAVKVTNNSSKSISFAENVKMYTGENFLLPVEPYIVKDQLKQNSPLYLLYFLLWLTITKCENYDCSTIPIPIGVPIGIGNMAVAGTANENFRRELESNNLFNRRIEPGETAYGLMGIRDTGFNPIRFVMAN